MKATEHAKATSGKIDGAVVNAAANKLKPFLEWTQAECDQLMAISCFAELYNFIYLLKAHCDDFIGT